MCERERKTKTQRSCSECIYGKAEREKESERVRALLRNERERGLMHTLSLSLSLSLSLTQPRAFADIVCVKERLRADDHWYLKKSREEENLRVVGVESASEK